MLARRALLAVPALLAPPSARTSAQILQGGRPMRWVVPFPPGGQADTVARIWADAFAARTGQTVVVDNRGGGSGVVGVQAVTGATPDGTTLGVFNISFFTALPLMLERPPFDPARDLLPVSRLATSTVLCCVTPERARERGWTDFRALIEWAKRPGARVTNGYAGTGGPGHLLMSTIARRSGANIEMVAYRGGAQSLADLIAGNIDMAFDQMPSLLPAVAAGRLVPLAVGSRQRSPLAPGVPGLGEFAELGLADLDMQSWNALTAPQGTPPAILEAIAAGVLAGAEHPGLRDRLATAGLVLETTTGPAETAAQVAADAPRWREMVEISGARIP